MIGALVPGVDLYHFREVIMRLFVSVLTFEGLSSVVKGPCIFGVKFNYFSKIFDGVLKLAQSQEGQSPVEEGCFFLVV